MKVWKIALATVALVAITATPALAGSYVKYACMIDGYSFGIARQGGEHASLRDMAGHVLNVHRKAASVGERYVGTDAEGKTVDVWMKDNDAVITVDGTARHNGCTIARFANPGAVNYICATGYTFATHVSGPAKLSYIDSYGNAADLAVAESKGHVRYTGTAVTGMTIDLSLANSQASLTTNRGSDNLLCSVR